MGLYMDDTDYANVLYTCQGTTNWTTSSLLYWPDAGTYTFRAYYPYMETVTNAVSLPADQSTAEAFTRADLMWAGTTRAATNGIISLTLNHQMSLIRLDVTDGEAISLNEIKSLDSYEESLKMLDDVMKVMQHNTLNETEQNYALLHINNLIARVR